MNLADLTVEQLKNLIANHEDKKRTDATLYAEAVEMLQTRQAGTLNIDKTVSCILASAARGEFLTYGDVARANGADWKSVRRPMAQHLDLVLKKSHARGAPMITAIVVNEPGRLSGDLADESLKGFIQGVERLGISVDDAEAFLREQQTETFDYAKAGNLTL